MTPHITNKPIFGFLSALLCLTAVARYGTAASLSGTVLQDNGQPLGGAKVYAQLQRASMAAPSFRADAVTEENGTFSMSGLAAGSYRICVQAAGTLFLNSCDWDLNPTTVTLGTASAAKAAAPVIRLQKGTALRVTISDPGGNLAPANAATKVKADPLVGVWLPSGLFLPALLVSQDKNSRVYQVPIANGVAVSLSVHGGDVQLSDSSGAAIDQKKGASVPVQAKDGSTGAFTFRVVGKASGH
jgi:hypothetical protein